MVTNSEGKVVRDVVITRVFDALRELVFKAWTDPAQVKEWFGPYGFTNPVCEIDLRVGGAFHVVMRSPEGEEYPSKGVYTEVDPPSRLAFSDVAEDAQGAVLLETSTVVTFEAEGSKTRVTMRSRGTALTDVAIPMIEGMQEGWLQTIDRFEQYFFADRAIIAVRVFDAPRELVYKAWTQPEHVAQWWGPNGFTNTVHEMDVRPGGVWRLTMHGPDGTDYPNLVTFIEVNVAERLVFDLGDDANPTMMRTTIIFTPEGEDKTRLTMQAVFESAAARDKMVEEVGAVEGQNQTLDRLGEYLAKM